jgi:hypothetical protein
MPLSERRGPLCRGPDCFTENGPCHPGCDPNAEAVQHIPVPSEPEQAKCTKGSLGTQWRDRLRWVVGWVVPVATVVTALAAAANGVHVLIDLISTFP